MTTAETLVEREARRIRPVRLGNDFAQYVRAIGRGDHERAAAILKTAVAGGTTTDPTWGGPLAALDGMRGFRQMVDRLAVVGWNEFASDPFSAPIPFETGTGSAAWVGEGQPAPVSSRAFLAATLSPLKVVSLSVVAEELLRTSSPGTEDRLLGRLASDLAIALNSVFLDANNSGIVGIRPAAITNGITPIAATGTTPAAVVADLAALVEAAEQSGAALERSVLVLSAAKALAAAMGAPDSGLTVRGGNFYGIPARVTPDALDDIVLIDTTGVAVARGAIDVDSAGSATLEMLDNPTNNVTTPTATTMVSMFQTNSVALRTRRFANWQRVRDNAVHFVQGPLS